MRIVKIRVGGSRFSVVDVKYVIYNPAKLEVRINYKDCTWVSDVCPRYIDFLSIMKVIKYDCSIRVINIFDLMCGNETTN